MCVSQALLQRVGYIRELLHKRGVFGEINGCHVLVYPPTTVSEHEVFVGGDYLLLYLKGKYAQRRFLQL